MRFPIEPAERKLILLCAGLLFGVTAAFIILKAARDALFLSDYPDTALPYFMGITTLVSVGIAFLFLRFYRDSSVAQLVEQSMKISAIGTIILWGGIKAEVSWISAVLYVWVGVFGTIAPVQCWSVITQQLLKRQAKRHIGFIGSGGILGATAGGFFASWITRSSSVSTLLPAAILMMAAVAFIVQSLPEIHTTASTENETADSNLNTKFVRLVVMVIAAGAIVSAFADFQFKVIAKRDLLTAERMASFFGTFYAYTGVVMLLIQAFATPALMRRLGVAAVLAILPIGLAAGNGWFLLTGSLASVICLKGAEQTLKHSVHRSAVEVIYMAIPDRLKIRLKSLIDTVGVQLSEAAAAGLLILLFSIAKLPLYVIAFMSVILLGIWLVGTFLLGREYPAALNNAMRQGAANFTSVRTTFFTTDFYRALPDLFNKSDRKTLLDLLQLLSGRKGLGTIPAVLLNHEDPEIRLRALDLLFEQEPDLSNKVEDLITDSDPRVRLKAIEYVCLRGSTDPVQKVAVLMNDPDPAVRVAACAGSLNLEKSLAEEKAHGQLQKLISDSMSSSLREMRLEVAKILRYVNPSYSSDQLFRRLLHDSSPAVQKAALQSLASVHPDSLLADVLSMIDHPEVRSQLQKVLDSYGPSAFPFLEQIVDTVTNPIGNRKFAFKILCDNPDPPVDVVIQWALKGDPFAHRLAINALGKFRKQRSIELSKDAADSIINQELLALQSEFGHMQFLSLKPHGMMDRVVRQRRQWAQERIFRVLGLLYDPKEMQDCYKAYTGGDRRKADSALEYLDTILLPSHRSIVIAMLEPARHEVRRPKAETDEKRSALLFFIEASDELPAAAMIADLTANELSSLEPEIRKALNTSKIQFLLQETLNWRCSMAENSDVLRKLSTIEKLEKLSTIDIFSELGPNELLLFAKQCAEEEFPAGTAIVSQGDPAKEIIMLIAGRVKLYRDSSRLLTIHPGQSFGELSVLAGHPHLFSAKTTEPSVCLKLTAESFWVISEDHPEICKAIFKIIAERASHLLVSKDVPQESNVK